jgi:hypothetical protein
MSKLPKIVAIISMVAGVIMMVVGVTTYFLVQRELSDENITVSDDAENFAGDEVDGPFTAYSQATVIKQHALEAGNGMTYAELDREDPARETVMNASFLRASLFTSVVAFGVAVLIFGLGVLVLLIGLGMFALDRRGAIAVGGAAVAVAPAADPPQTEPAEPVGATADLDDSGDPRASDASGETPT